MAGQRPSGYNGLMAKPSLRRLHSPDVDDLRTYQPEGPNFGFLLQMMIGPLGSEGEESFDAVVCSPGWLFEQYPSDSPVSGRHHIFMLEYDYAKLLEFIESYLAECSGATWDEVALCVSRFGKWEFEDYKEFEPSPPVE